MDKKIKKIGIIGYGIMGRAISERLKADFSVSVFDKDSIKTQELSGIKKASSLAGLLKNNEAVILAVKPQDFEELLNAITVSYGSFLIISIAAGIATQYIENKLKTAHVIRVMPNLPAKIGQGMSCLSKGALASEDDLVFAQGLFERMGKTLVIKEEMMDAATAVSGSGPGFLFEMVANKNREEFIPALTASAVSLGFTPEQAKLLAVTTANASALYLAIAGICPEEAVKQVASKGGTTEAGLQELRKGKPLLDAVKAALKRAQELSRR